MVGWKGVECREGNPSGQWVRYGGGGQGSQGAILYYNYHKGASCIRQTGFDILGSVCRLQGYGHGWMMEGGGGEIGAAQIGIGFDKRILCTLRSR